MKTPSCASFFLLF